MPNHPDSQTRLARFKQARFGLFITWGLYAIPGHGEWAMALDSIPADDYRRLADRFQPRHFDANAWARLAVKAGMRYGVLVARHADGFCLFESQHSVGRFTSTATRAGRDFVAEYVAAFRRHGLMVGLYYHLGDWREPGYFDPRRHPESARRMRESAHRQVEELMTHYGRIDLLWYDGWYWEHGHGKLWPGLPRPYARRFWQAEKLNARVRHLQPQILINDRSGPSEDFGTPEQKVQAEKDGRAWETCMTIGRQWGHVRYDSQRKSPNELLMQIIEAVSQGGNFLLNVGPRADGTIDPRDVQTLTRIGNWVRAHAPAVYGPLKPAAQWWLLNGRLAQQGKTLFYYLYEWPGSEASLAELISPVKTARLMETGQSLRVRQDAGGRTLIDLPARPPTPNGIHVIRLDFACEPRFRTTPACCWDTPSDFSSLG